MFHSRTGVVVAAAGEQRAVRADVERANPTLVGVDRADGRRRFGGRVPPGELAVATAADGLRAVLRKRQRLHPGFVAAAENACERRRPA